MSAFPSRPPAVTAAFLGAATLLLSDGHTHLLTDGFFSRPSLPRVLFTPLRPEVPAIQCGLARAGIRRLDAVLVSHSHYDHALDAPEVARALGTRLVGSESTANIGRGAGLPESQIRVMQPGQPMEFGAFRVTFLPSAHSLPNLAAGFISRPLRQPARAFDYKDGGCHSLLIEHPCGALLIQPSANFCPGALEGRSAVVAMLSLGSLGRRSPAYQCAYFDQVAGAVGARVVYPIHHDDFTRPLDEILRPMPWLMDDTPAALRALHAWAVPRAVSVREFQPWQPVQILPVNL
jgi:L-ascorbate metabolism protein UlaG (beta-lactamase superfamily)